MSILPLNQGGTGSDLSGTGGTGQVVKQTSSGADLTVAAIAAADLPTSGTWSFSGTVSGSPTFSGQANFTDSVIQPGIAVIVLSGSSDPYGGLIQNAINALPTAGGVIDARASGVASVAQGVVDPGSKSVTILLGVSANPYVFTQIRVRTGLKIIGADQQRSIIQASSTTGSQTGQALFLGPINSDPIALSFVFQDLIIQGPNGFFSTSTPNYVDCFHFDGSGGLYTNASSSNGVWNRVGIGGFGGSSWKFLGGMNSGASGINEFHSFYDCSGGCNQGLVGTAAGSGLALTAAATASGGTTVYTGTITGGGSNAYVGWKFGVVGFVTHTSNNGGPWVCTASTTTTITLTNPSGVAETHAATVTATPMGPAILYQGPNFQQYWYNCQVNGYESDNGIDESNGICPLIYVGNTGNTGLSANSFQIGFYGMTVQGRNSCVQFDGATQVIFDAGHFEQNAVCFYLTSGYGIAGGTIPAGNSNINNGIVLTNNSFNGNTGIQGGNGSILQVSTTKVYGVQLKDNVYNSSAVSPDHWVNNLSTPAIPVIQQNNLDTFKALTVTGSGVIAPVATPTIAGKTGSGSGNYVSTPLSTSYAAVDATNLSYTVTIPIGWKLLIRASGNIQSNSGSVAVFAALVDTATSITLAENVTINVAGAPSTFALDSEFTGDGASHTIQLQFKTTNGSDQASINNTSVTSSPKMTFLLSPTN
jgi:hypothetical protein